MLLNIFVAGATGAVGSPLVCMLCALGRRGTSIRAQSPSHERMELIGGDFFESVPMQADA